MKRIVSLLLCVMLLFGICGCQKDNELEPNNIKTEEQELDIEKLEQEYTAMINLAEDLFTMFEDAEGQMSADKAIQMLEFVQHNRIKPTQKLTIELDQAFEELIDLTIQYGLSSNSEKAEFEARITEVLYTMEAICVEIETVLDEANTIE